jgi:uncharacterized repeat protein (TIGR03803 family)
VDGDNPRGTLVQATDGNLYGITEDGGIYNGGTVFRMTLSGSLTTIHSFEGMHILTGLVQGVDGNLYGTTATGGAYGGGTVFELSTTGTFSVLYSFCAESDCRDGNYPVAPVIQATDGNIYGTTYNGGNGGLNGLGTVFKITPGGMLTTLHRFCGPLAGCNGPMDDGAGPGALVQDTNGGPYGTTLAGGYPGPYGTVFSLSVGLGRFVKTIPTSGKLRTSVMILGTDLTGATNVTFNGTPATFTVESGSFIKATVPAGATTGTVQVATPGSTLSSNAPFRVAP